MHQRTSFLGGSDWWMIPSDIAEYCYYKSIIDKKLMKCFKYSFIPVEMFFQTVICNSPFRTRLVDDNYRYTRWKSGMGKPEIINQSDF